MASIMIIAVVILKIYDVSKKKFVVEKFHVTTYYDDCEPQYNRHI